MICAENIMKEDIVEELLIIVNKALYNNKKEKSLQKDECKLKALTN